MKSEIGASTHVDIARISMGYAALSMRAIAVLTLVLSATGCLSPQERVIHHEDNLSAAGFIIRPADSPERRDMLVRLPPHQFVQCKHGDTVTFVYADPLVCRCLYVGTQAAYIRFKSNGQVKELANEELLTATNYENAAWNWGGWGSWDRAYGFGYAVGW